MYAILTDQKIHQVLRRLLPTRFCQPEITFSGGAPEHITTTIRANWFGSLINLTLYQVERTYVEDENGGISSSLAATIFNRLDKKQQEFFPVSQEMLETLVYKRNSFFGIPRPDNVIDFLFEHKSPGVELGPFVWNKERGILRVEVLSVAGDGAYLFDLRDIGAADRFKQLLFFHQDRTIPIRFVNRSTHEFYPFAVPAMIGWDQNDIEFIESLENQAVVL